MFKYMFISISNSNNEVEGIHAITEHLHIKSFHHDFLVHQILYLFEYCKSLTNISSNHIQESK